MWVNLTVSLVRNEAGQPQWFVSVVKDINERKRGEEELIKSAKRYKEAQSLAHIGHWDYEPYEENLFWSDELYSIFEIDKDAGPLSIEDFIERIHPEDRDTIREQVKKGESYCSDYRIVMDNGSVKHIHEEVLIVHQEDGKIVLTRGTAQDITERKQAEQTLQAYQQRLKALVSQLTIAEEKERRRIAADMHDHVGQSLALARMQIAAACKSASDAVLTTKLADISKTLLQDLQDTRHLIFKLSSPSMHEIGLRAAISEWLEEEIGKRYDLKTQFIDNIDESHRKLLDENVRAILFRNVRELLTNVVKHAQASQVSVLMEHANAFLNIVIQDDGVGFDYDSKSQTGKSEGGFGLFSIHERMADLGGSLEIISRTGSGCTAIISVPLDSGLASGSAYRPASGS